MVEFILASLVAPSAVAFGAILLLERLLGERKIPAAPLALSLGFFVGYLLLSGAPLRPQRHWHWLPYAGLLAAAAGSVLAERRSLWRVAIFLVVCATVVWFLVPTWEALQPPRGPMMVVLAVYLWFLGVGTDRVFDDSDQPHRLFLAILAAAAAISAACIAKEVSLTYGRVAALAAAALTGVWLAGVGGFTRNFRSIGGAYAVLVGGTAFVGCIDPEPPRWGLMLLPPAPLGAFAAVLLPQDSRYRTIVQVVGFLAMMGVGVAVIYATKGSPAAEW